MSTSVTLITSDRPGQQRQAIHLLSRISRPTLALIGIILLAAVLNFANIGAVGDGNTYYTAAIEAMLQSPSNFFFVAAEPGGSVTIDKPPLGLWLQAISAMFLGVNGFAVVLPQILAGIFSVPLLYILVKRYAGSGAGLIAALVMAVMPVTIAVQRNNTMDATLIFTLLLAAWAFMKATDTGKLRWLALGGVLVGLGFNIKMLQAFLPLPAFYALYFFGANVRWRKKIAHLALTTVVLLAVSLSWIVAVDLTPADSRPYVGSSTTNSALELAIGYNGVLRLLGITMGGMTRPDGNGQAFTPPAGVVPSAGAVGAGGGMFPDEIGSAGVLRLFSQPLDNEIGWLLPFALISLGVVVVTARARLPLSIQHQGALLWGGWLVTEVIFFSAAGFFHAYYLAMLTPPIAALVGLGVMRLWQLRSSHQRLATMLLVLTVGATLAYQVSIAAGYTTGVLWVIIPVGILLTGAMILLIGQFVPRLSRLATVGLVCMVVALTAIPTAWAGMGTLQASANQMLPGAYGGTTSRNDGPPNGMSSAANMPSLGGLNGAPGAVSVDKNLIAYLQANTQGMRWMMAVGSSMQGAGYVLDTGRGVLYMGGFNGQDPVVDADSLQALVDAGELRYVLIGGEGRSGPGMGTNTAISAWLSQSCAAVTDVTISSGTLYDCAN